ncbi:macro domain-containing protein [Prevotella sp. P6B4]|uniref:macro domain-containing protein n=1 Tax=Prevotella sp. P6B4 TaxID=1410614 RepID=UPI0012DDC543|nr:macro domain-containing protein [Prevotella sp. P6B4]
MRFFKQGILEILSCGHWNHPDDYTRLHDETEAYFASNKIDGIEVDRPNSEGYKKKYPLGTCAIIDKDNTHYVLLALTHFDEEDHAYVELSEFGRSISSMCRYLSDKVGDTPVYMPLMGMGMARLNQPAQFILKYTLDTIVGIKGLAMLFQLSVRRGIITLCSFCGLYHIIG